MSSELIIKKADPEMTEDQLPSLLPQQRIMLHYILEGNDYTTAYRKAGYNAAPENQDKAAYILVTRNPLKAHLGYFAKELSKLITPDWKAQKLAQIVNNSLNKDEPQLYDPEIAIKAIAELNKMSGDYAAQTSQVQHLHASIDDIRNARLEYKNDK